MRNGPLATGFVGHARVFGGEFRRPRPQKILIHRNMIRYGDEFRIVESMSTWFSHQVVMFVQLWLPLT